MAALPKDPKLQASIAQGGAGYDIVQHAVHRGTPAILRELIRLGANIRENDSAPYPKGKLLLSAVYGWYSWNDARNEPPPGVGAPPAFAETIQVLIDAGARVDVTGDVIGSHYDTALTLVADRPRLPQAMSIATVLVNNGAPLDEGSSPLIVAMGRDSLEMVELMLRSPGVPQRAKDLALREAIHHKKGAFAIALMNAGATPDVPPPVGAYAQDASSLYEAVFPKVNRELVKALIAKKVSPNVVGRDGSTPLIQVIGDFELALLLLDARADPDVRRTSDGKTALHVAVMLPDVKIRYDVVDLLLRRKANPNITDTSSYTALMYVPSADLGVMEAILNAGGKVVVQRDRRGLLPAVQRARWARNVGHRAREGHAGSPVTPSRRAGCR
jgi:ankyrin repeat protein